MSKSKKTSAEKEVVLEQGGVTVDVSVKGEGNGAACAAGTPARKRAAANGSKTRRTSSRKKAAEPPPPAPAVPDVQPIREELHRGRTGYFSRMLEFLGVSGIDTAQFADEDKDAIRNFRSGRVDEWKEVLSPEQRSTVWPVMAPIADRFAWTR